MKVPILLFSRISKFVIYHGLQTLRHHNFVIRPNSTLDFLYVVEQKILYQICYFTILANEGYIFIFCPKCLRLAIFRFSLEDVI